ncbi:hypothetical protein BsWGS_00382 [Bradybaena similaris]
MVGGNFLQGQLCALCFISVLCGCFSRDSCLLSIEFTLDNEENFAEVHWHSNRAIMGKPVCNAVGTELITNHSSSPENSDKYLMYILQDQNTLKAVPVRNNSTTSGH